ncbi:MAG: DNA methyltransferase [Candidatus Thorarchaeota archaeon]
MVEITWKNKEDITDNIQNLKNYFKDKFNIIKIKSDLYEEFNQNTEKVWRNKLFWADNLEVLLYLLNNFEEKINLIYIDPPFFTGVNYHIDITEDDNNYNTVAYYDHWNKDLDSYLQMLYERIILLRELLAKEGLLFLHLDWHASHYIKLILDEVFGEKRFVNEIIWYYYNKYSAGKMSLPRAHDNILVYCKSENHTFNEIRIPRKEPIKQLKREMVNGVLKNVKDENGHVIYRMVTDKKLDDVWRIPCMQPASKEWTGFPTQKHHDLVSRIIELGSNEGDLIADFFCGSGTTLLEATKLNRKWIGCDISEYSIYLTSKRIMEYLKSIPKNKSTFYPFEVVSRLNSKQKKIIRSGFFEKELKFKRKK